MTINTKKLLEGLGLTEEQKARLRRRLVEYGDYVVANYSEPRKMDVTVVGTEEQLDRAFRKQRTKPNDKQRKLARNK